MFVVWDFPGSSTLQGLPLAGVHPGIRTCTLWGLRESVFLTAAG